MYTLPEDANGSNVPNSKLVLLEPYKDMFIKVNRWGHFNKSDIGLNDIHVVLPETHIPAFVTMFEQMLESRPGLHPDVPSALDPESRATFFETREDSTIDESHEEMQQPLRYAEKLEALHIANVASYGWQQLWQEGTAGKRALKGDLTNDIFFFQVSCVPTIGATSVARYVLTCPL